MATERRGISAHSRVVAAIAWALVILVGIAAAMLATLAAADAILRETLALRGTLSGEHGSGLLKRELLASELGAGGTRISRAIKEALDPPRHPQPELLWEADLAVSFGCRTPS